MIDGQSWHLREQLLLGLAITAVRNLDGSVSSCGRLVCRVKPDPAQAKVESGTSHSKKGTSVTGGFSWVAEGFQGMWEFSAVVEENPPEPSTTATTPVLRG